MAKELHNGMDIIDSRDVIARIRELESDAELYLVDADEAMLTEDEKNDTWVADDTRRYSDLFSEDEYNELKALKALAEEAEGCGDWAHGEALIRDGYFETYAEQLADDIGAIDRNVSWPVNHIDWEAAADDLKQDYTSVDFDGETYWMRS